MKNIAVLTSSRADYGIYLPLLKHLKSNPNFELNIIAFGTHLSKYHGYSVSQILKDGFEVKHTISSLITNDTPESIATSYALTSLKFAQFWEQNNSEFDIVFCLGDRFEMAAAVYAGIPFNIKFAHIHGGETTLGAIDNIYRHAITLASQKHYVATQQFKEKVFLLTGNEKNINVVGSLSLDNLEELELLTIQQFYEKWKIDLNNPCVLSTIHPETVNVNENEKFVGELLKSFEEIIKTHKVIITLPNADTSGTIFRNAFIDFNLKYPSSTHIIENFGTQSYFTCMKYCSIMIGNTSSGIIEAASFNKYVINIGDRQKGRLSSDNVINVSFNKNEIINEFQNYINKEYLGNNIYKFGKASELIISDLL